MAEEQQPETSGTTQNQKQPEKSEKDVPSSAGAEKVSSVDVVAGKEDNNNDNHITVSQNEQRPLQQQSSENNETEQQQQMTDDDGGKGNSPQHLEDQPEQKNGMKQVLPNSNNQDPKPPAVAVAVAVPRKAPAPGYSKPPRNPTPPREVLQGMQYVTQQQKRQPPVQQQQQKPQVQQQQQPQVQQQQKPQQQAQVQQQPQQQAPVQQQQQEQQQPQSQVQQLQLPIKPKSRFKLVKPQIQVQQQQQPQQQQQQQQPQQQAQSQNPNNQPQQFFQQDQNGKQFMQPNFNRQPSPQPGQQPQQNQNLQQNNQQSQQFSHSNLNQEQQQLHHSGGQLPQQQQYDQASQIVVEQAQGQPQYSHQLQQANQNPQQQASQNPQQQPIPVQSSQQGPKPSRFSVQKAQQPVGDVSQSQEQQPQQNQVSQIANQGSNDQQQQNQQQQQQVPTQEFQNHPQQGPLGMGLQQQQQQQTSPHNQQQQPQGFNAQPNQQQIYTPPQLQMLPQDPSQQLTPLPQLALATDQQHLRKQLQEQGKVQPQYNLGPVAPNAQIVGMVGTTPIVKIQGTAGHVVKKKKGRFKLLAQEPPAAATATAPVPLETPAGNETAPAEPVPSVVVANRERTLSNGSAMSQITNATHAHANANQHTFDGTGAPVVKKKGRFMVTNVKNPGMLPAQQQQQGAQPPAPAPKNEATVNQQQTPPTAGQNNMQGSPSHNPQMRGDQSVHVSQNAPVQQDQQQQQANRGTGEIPIPPQQHVLLPDNGMQIHVMPPQNLAQQHHLVYPAQMIHAQTPVQQVYSSEERVNSNGGQNNAVPDAGTSYQPQDPPVGGIQIPSQNPVYNTQSHSMQQPAVAGVEGQSQQGLTQQPPQQWQNLQQYQAQQAQQPPMPPTPPPANVIISNQNGSPGNEMSSAPPLNANITPMKQGQQAPTEEGSVPAAPAAAPSSKTPKQPPPQGAPRAQPQPQPPRNKQRNLVAPRNATGYTNGAAGLGKVFYFLDQMKNEVTEADRTIKTLQKDMKFMREKNKELETRNRELERRLREEQALREAAQAKLRVLKKKGRDDKGLEADEEQKGQRKPRASDSPEKALEPKKLPTSGKVKPSTDNEAAQQLPAQSANAKQNRATSNQTNKVAPKNEQSMDSSKQKGPKPAQPLVRKNTATESTIAERNMAQLEAKKGIPVPASKPTKQNGRAVPPVSRQGTIENTEPKLAPTPNATGQLTAPNSPPRSNVQPSNVSGVSQQIGSVSNAQEGIQSANNGSSNIARAGTVPANNDARVNNTNQANQRSSTNWPKIPSAIEFDPLKSAPPGAPGLSLDDNGRNTPIDSQSVSSANAGFTSADIGLGVNNGYHVQNSYSQPYDAGVGHSQMAIPVVGLMSYQQSNGAYPQGATMMQVAQQQYPHSVSEVQNGGVSSNVSVLQQPYLQVSTDQQTVHSVPMADLSQPMILIQPQHVRGVSMHDFSVDTMVRNPSDIFPNIQHHHSRGNSLHTFPNFSNVNASWNQNAQWDPMANANMGQQQQQPQATGQQNFSSTDPFDELVTRRPMSTLPNGD